MVKQPLQEERATYKREVEKATIIMMANVSTETSIAEV